MKKLIISILLSLFVVPFTATAHATSIAVIPVHINRYVFDSVPLDGVRGASNANWELARKLIDEGIPNSISNNIYLVPREQVTAAMNEVWPQIKDEYSAPGVMVTPWTVDNIMEMVRKKVDADVIIAFEVSDVFHQREPEWTKRADSYCVQMNIYVLDNKTGYYCGSGAGSVILDIGSEEYLTRIASARVLKTLNHEFIKTLEAFKIEFPREWEGFFKK